MDQSRTVNRDILAQAGNPTSVAGPTIRRQCNPREEPRALTGMRGSARGVLSNGDSYRNHGCGPESADTRRSSLQPRGEDSMTDRNLAETVRHSGGVEVTAR